MTRALRVTVTVPEETVAAVDNIARRTHTSRSKVVSQILNRAALEAQHKSLVEGYQAISDETAEFVESAWPLAAEVWPKYDEEEPDESGREE